MKPILFATGNNQKFRVAESLCTQAGFKIEQISVDIDEIQGEEPHKIVADKVARAFELLHGKNVVVTDDSWDIVGLGGFPGPYMKSVTNWLTPEQFVDLGRSLSDRTVYLHQYLAYKSSNEIVVFNQTLEGKLALEPRGSYGSSWHKVVCMKSDSCLTLSEVFEQGSDTNIDRLSKNRDVWQDFIDWYKKVHV